MHADRFLYGQDFVIHVSAVRQAHIVGIWFVEVLVEIVGQVEKPAPRSQRISTECGSARLTLGVFTSLLVVIIACRFRRIRGNCRFVFRKILQLQMR